MNFATAIDNAPNWVKYTIVFDGDEGQASVEADSEEEAWDAMLSLWDPSHDLW
jgi:hypothetical protein